MSWPLKPVSELCEFAIDCVNKTAPVVDVATPYKMIRTTNVKGGFIDVLEVRHVSKDTFEKWTRRSRPRYGDVVLTREAPVGEVGRCTFSDDENIFLGQRLFHYRPNPDVLDWNYLAYILQSPEVQGRFHGRSFGATVPHVKVADAESLLIPCPPLDVQKKLGTVLANYDDLIATNQRRITLLEDAARRLYREWFVHLRFPGHESVAVKDGMPDRWSFAPLAGLCEEVRDMVDPTAISPETAYLSMEHMPQKSISLSVWESAQKVGSTKLRFQVGDVLFGKIRPYFHKVGLAAIAGITSTDVIVVRVVDLSALPLVLMIMSSTNFVGHAVTTSNGTKMPRADWKILRQWPVLIPDDTVLLQYQSAVSPLLDQMSTLVFQNRALARARDLLLPKLMSGQLDVSRIPLLEETLA